MKIVPDMWRFAIAIGNSNPLAKEVLQGNIRLQEFSNDRDGAFAVEFEDRIILSFQGTKSLKAWILNFDPFPYGEGTIHQGFYNGWAKCKSFVDGFFMSSLAVTGQDFSSCKKPVYVTGHSRGGILSTLCARHLAKNRGIKPFNISFGAPAGFNKAGREQFEFLPIYCTRVVNNWDLVPTSFLIQTVFRQVGNLFQLPKTWWHEFFTSARVHDHYYSNYTRAIRDYCQREGDVDGVIAMNKLLPISKP